MLLTQADHNNMDAPSIKALEKDGGLDGAFPANLKGFPGSMPPHPPRIFWPFSHKKQRTLSRNLQQVSHSLETLRLERSTLYNMLLNY